jgi:hypothetical protein
MLIAAVIGTLYLPLADGQTRQPVRQATRTEHDLLGDKQIPADAYYGVQTARALENFQISAERPSKIDLQSPSSELNVFRCVIAVW